LQEKNDIKLQPHARLRDLIKKLGSPEALAALLGVTASYVGQMERGTKPIPQKIELKLQPIEAKVQTCAKDVSPDALSTLLLTDGPPKPQPKFQFTRRDLLLADIARRVETLMFAPPAKDQESRYLREIIVAAEEMKALADAVKTIPSEKAAGDEELGKPRPPKLDAL
jgi:hypothetical protein